MATAYPDESTPASGRIRGSAAGVAQDRRLRLDDILKLMVADGLILPADAERIGRTRTQRFEHPLELVAEQRLKSLAPPHKALTLEPLVEWLAGKLDVRAKQEALLRDLMIEGIVAIQAGEKPQLIKEKLKGFLPPAQRVAVAS